MYPNPNTGKFIIELPDLIESKNVEILNVSGQLVYENLVSEGEISLHVDLANQPKGMYIIKTSTYKSIHYGRILLE